MFVDGGFPDIPSTWPTSWLGLSLVECVVELHRATMSVRMGARSPVHSAG
jgi:hypothetical protein